MRLIVCTLTLCLSLVAQAAKRPRGCAQVLNLQSEIRERIGSTNDKKGTFEALFPIEPGSIAARFPKLYDRILELFHDRPSFLHGINRGNPPFPGMPMRQIYENIRDFAERTGDFIDFLAQYSIPEGDPALDILRSYTRRFQHGLPIPPDGGRFDPADAHQFSHVTRFGKARVCSIWSELRLSLRIGMLSRVNVTVRELIRDRVIDNRAGFLEGSLLDQEIDHLWFPQYSPKPDPESTRETVSYQPDAIAFGDTKVFDSVFAAGHPKRKKVYEQLQRYLRIASLAGHQMGLPPQLYYFFVAGVSPGEITKLRDLAQAFNDRIRHGELDAGHFAPVELFVYGDYGKF